MLLDFLTVFFIVAGCVLLWLNLRQIRHPILLTKTDDLPPDTDISPDDFPLYGLKPAERPASAPSQHGLDDPEKHPLIDVPQQHLSEAQANQEAAAEGNAYANRVAAGMLRARKSRNQIDRG